MLNIIHRLTSSLSIKNIVILGVVVMATLIVAFAITMNYLSSTIKYDQSTLKHILNLENQNQRVLNTIKDIDYINNKTTTSSSIKDIESFEKDLIIDVKFDFMKLDVANNDQIKSYNKEILYMNNMFSELIALQKSMYGLKSTMLYYKKDLIDYKETIDNTTNSISNETESIFGKASLLTKRYNRALKKSQNINILRNNGKLLTDLSKVMTISTDLDKSILKLPTLIDNINNTSSNDIINSIEKNQLRQLIILFENSLKNIDNLKYLEEDFKPSIKVIKSKFSETVEQIHFLITVKKQLLKVEDKMKLFQINYIETNNKIFNSINNLDLISKNIKFDTLNNSDSISEKTTYVIFIVGFLSLILITWSAITLISRINIPLGFITNYIEKIKARQKKLSSKLPIFIDDEFGDLSHSFNDMTSTIDKNIKEIQELNKEIENTQKEVIFTMGAIGESRSKETGNHVRRVAEYSRILALGYGLDKNTANLLKEASPMHDIGKVGIPDSILEKPGKLNDEEWIVMKTHAQLGYDMLKHSKRTILQAASIVAHEHHEKWDGSGYPRGLKGEDIHIFGRITAIADVFDALGSDRCYKKAWKLEDIKKYFKDNRGKHFDPKLVDIFFKSLDELLFVREKYKDEFE